MDKVITTKVYLDPEDVKDNDNLIKIGEEERRVIANWIEGQKLLNILEVRVFTVAKQMLKSIKYDYWIEKEPSEIDAEDLINLMHHESKVRMPLPSELLIAHIYGIAQGYWAMNNAICKPCVICWESNSR